jgi:hypothetical protein
MRYLMKPGILKMPGDTSVFVSHSSKDKAFARRLKNDLAVFGIDVWLDEVELSAGDRLEEMIRSSIQYVNYLAVVFSGHSVRSEWVGKEVNIAIGEGIEVVPILLQNISPDQIDHVPPALRNIPFIDFTKSQDKDYHRAFHDMLARLGYRQVEKDALVIYADGLAPGWESGRSWGCNFQEKVTRFVHSGQYAMRVLLDGYGGLVLSFGSGINTRGYSRLEMFIHGGETGGQKLQIYVCDELRYGARKPVDLEPLILNHWTWLQVPLTDLEAENEIIFRITLLDNLGERQPAFYVDDIALIR